MRNGDGIIKKPSSSWIVVAPVSLELDIGSCSITLREEGG
jgi:hypothetical protein